jgi:hypothetical protein
MTHGLDSQAKEGQDNDASLQSTHNQHTFDKAATTTGVRIQFMQMLRQERSSGTPFRQRHGRLHFEIHLGSKIRQHQHFLRWNRRQAYHTHRDSDLMQGLAVYTAAVAMPADVEFVLDFCD